MMDVKALCQMVLEMVTKHDGTGTGTFAICLMFDTALFWHPADEGFFDLDDLLGGFSPTPLKHLNQIGFIFPKVSG